MSRKDLSFFYGNYNSEYIVCGSSGHSLLTAGKETPPISKLKNRIIKEYEFNQAVKIGMFEGLERCGIASLDTNFEQNKNVTLQLRCDRANDLIRKDSDLLRVAFQAIHYNAYDGIFDTNAGGISVYHYPGSTRGKTLATYLHNEIIKGTAQRDRGILTAKFFVLKNTRMPAILSENGFMDVLWEALLMIDKDFQFEVAEEHVKAYCKYFKVKYIEPKKPTKKLYKVQIGAFSNRENADRLAMVLKSMGYPILIKYE